MDPIEIFELAGYAIQAAASDPEQAVFTTEIRPYVVQNARSKTALFASEMRAYAVQTGKPKSGVSLNATKAYVITHSRNMAGVKGDNTPKYRDPGVTVRKAAMWTITGPNSAGIHNNTPPGRSTKFGGDGVAVLNSRMYSIEVP